MPNVFISRPPVVRYAFCIGKVGKLKQWKGKTVKKNNPRGYFKGIIRWMVQVRSRSSRDPIGKYSNKYPHGVGMGSSNGEPFLTD